MQLTTFAFFALLAFFTWRGYHKGFIGSIVRILGWIVAYPAAIVFTKPLATLLMRHTALDGLLVYFVAGASIFLLVSFLVSLMLHGISRLIPKNDKVEISSKIGGAGVGVLMGALVGLLVVYFLGLLLTPKPHVNPEQTLVGEAATPAQEQISRQSAPNAPSIRDLQKHNDSFIEASAKKLIGAAASTAVNLALEDKTAAQITTAFVQDPQSMLTHIQQVTNDGQMKNLLADEHIQSILTTGDTHALKRDPAFQEMMANQSVQALLSQSDVSSEEGSQAAAEKMVAAWSRVQTIKHDPRVIAIINDPEFQQQINSPNKLQLLTNPKLNQLASIIFSNETLAANGMGSYEIRNVDERAGRSPVNLPAENGDEKPKTTIYRWTDEKGQVHYSDKPVNNQRDD